MGYAIQEIRSDEELAALGPEWDELLAASRSNTIFLTREWLCEWRRCYRPHDPLRVVALRDGAGRLAGLAPLAADRVRVGPAGRFRALRLLGDGSWDSDYLDLICRAGEEPDVAAALLAHLDAAADWDVLLLNEVPADSPVLPALGEACRRRRYGIDETRYGCSYAPLPREWDAFLAMLKPRFRTKVRSLLRSLGEASGEPPEYCRDAAELDGWLETLFDLHTRRWQAIGQAGVFGDARKREFYRRMGRRFLERGWLRFSRLREGDRVVAMQFCFEYDNRTFLLQEGYDPDEAHRNAGHTLRALVFADNVRRGVAVYDFLGGVADHKLLWGAQVKEAVRLAITRRGARGRLYRLLTHDVARLKDAVRAAAPDWAIRAGKRVLRRGGGA